MTGFTETQRCLEEAEEARARVERDLFRLREKLTPGQLLDEGLSFMKGNNSGMLSAVGNAARDNPIPSILIGAGCAMFVSDKLRGKTSGASPGRFYRSRGSAYPDEEFEDAARRTDRSFYPDTDEGQAGVTHKMRRAAGAVGDRMSSTASSLRETAGETASSIGDRVSDTTASVGGRIRNTASSIGESVSGTASHLRDGMSETASHLRGNVAGMGESFGDGASWARENASAFGRRTQHAASRAAERTNSAVKSAASSLQQQPWLLAAIGIAAGALAAALLPRSRVEDEWMGEASDAVKEDLSSTASEQWDKATATASQVVDEVKTVAEDEGLSIAGAADTGREMTEKLRRVAEEVSASADEPRKSEWSNRESGR